MLLQLAVENQTATIEAVQTPQRVFACLLDIESGELLNVQDFPDIEWDAVNQRLHIVDRLTVGSAFFVATSKRELIAVLPIKAKEQYNVYWAIRGLLHLINGLTMLVTLLIDNEEEVRLAVDDHNLGNTAISDPDKQSVTVIDNDMPWAYLLSDDAK